MTNNNEYENLLVIDATGRRIGEVRGYDVFDLQGRKVFEAKPKTTFKEIVTVLQKGGDGK